MKKLLLTVACTMLSIAAIAQTQLPAPQKKAKTLSVMEALSTRHSERAFSDRALTPQELSNLLWAATGVNRPDGHITAPTAMNKQEIRLYVFTVDGVYEYLPQTHELREWAKGDHRAIVAGRQEFAKSAPVSLVMVGDYNKFGNSNDHARQMVAVDAGIMCQNINLYCAAAGLATVPRATMDVSAIVKLLGLNSNQQPILNNPVGFPAK
ncbi:MAG: SagB/ThcOx family dehydrogenase [Bacteroidales bacterium]|nr:SagB/ThcOx family dehydrogenase [Bacteroidales bacterium]